MTDWRAVQTEMLELEQTGLTEPDVLSVIAVLLGEDDVEGLHETLTDEARRIAGPIMAHYSEFTNMNEPSKAAIGLMQGITFARAYDRVKQDD